MDGQGNGHSHEAKEGHEVSAGRFSPLLGSLVMHRLYSPRGR